jgi:hypothetical protein
VVEHLLAKEKVAGSIPVSRSRFAYIRSEHKHTFGREFVPLVGKCICNLHCIDHNSSQDTKG